MQAVLDGGVKATTKAVQAYASALGLSVDAVTGFTQDINIVLTGLDKDGVQKKLLETFAGFGDAMVTDAYGKALEGMAKKGETSTQTLERLASSLTGVNSVLESFGNTLFSISIKGAAGASALVDAMGGLEAFQQQTADYFKNFYSEADQKTETAKQIQSTLGGAGLNINLDQIMGGTREQFKLLVDAQDLTTDSGRKTFAALMQVQGAFASITPAVGSATDSLMKAAVDTMDISKATAATLPASVREYTAYSRLLASGASLTQRALNFDGTVTQAQALSNGLTSMFQASLTLVTEIKAQATQASETFAASRTTMLLDTMTAEEKYAYWDTKTHLDLEALKAAVDPVDIRLLAADINKSTMEGWALLDADQKRANRAKFDTILAEADALVAERFGIAETNVTNTTDSTHDVVLDTIIAGMDVVIDKDGKSRSEHNAQLSAILDKATAAIEAAAAVLQKAADAERKIEIKVNSETYARTEVDYA